MKTLKLLPDKPKRRKHIKLKYEKRTVLKMPVTKYALMRTPTMKSMTPMAKTMKKAPKKHWNKQYQQYKKSTVPMKKGKVPTSNKRNTNDKKGTKLDNTNNAT
ncbi:21593_t:CDS:2, partial [Gigaspora rosea]